MSVRWREKVGRGYGGRRLKQGSRSNRARSAKYAAWTLLRTDYRVSLCLNDRAAHLGIKLGRAAGCLQQHAGTGADDCQAALADIWEAYHFLMRLCITMPRNDPASVASVVEGKRLLDSEAVDAIRGALVIGLTAFGEIERAIEALRFIRFFDQEINDFNIIHPTGAADTTSQFAEALAYLQG